MLSLSGCATLKAEFGSPVIDDAVIDAAVAATVGTNKVTAVARAQTIKNVAEKLLADETALTSLATLGSVINAELGKLNLPPADLALAQELSTALELSAAAYLKASGKGLAAAAVAVAVSTVLKQIIVEATAFGAT